MELGELKTFVTVAAERSFSLAAIRLCRTQPAVSQVIRRLEEDLGERLFDRSAKHPTLTPAGNALLPEALRLLRMADETTATIRQLSQRDRAVLRIGGDEAAAHALLPALSIFLARQPRVSIEFRRVVDLDILGEVGAGAIDIGVTTRERVPRAVVVRAGARRVRGLLRPAASETPLCVPPRGADDDAAFPPARHAGWCATTDVRLDVCRD
jgi:DNA-binding transcriptional LysR family regulator